MKTEQPDSVLVIAPRRLGDSVLSLPALQLFREEQHPDTEITVLAEAECEPFWRLSPSVDFFQCLETFHPKVGNFDRAYILRDDFRAALIARRAGIVRRIGFSGNGRKLLLTEIVHRPDGHRQFDFLNILGVQGEPPAPGLNVRQEQFQTLERKLMHLSAFAEASADKPNIGENRAVIFQTLEEERPLGARPVITVLPGGIGARWPHGHYGLLAKNLMSSLNAVLLVAGDSADSGLCAQVAAAAGPDALNLAGRITLAEQAALLSVSDCTVCNAGGGMHLAAALGTPVVPVCGLTDPKKNAPLGPYARFDEKNPPDAEPEFEEVTRTLTAVTTDMAYAAVVKMTGVR